MLNTRSPFQRNNAGFIRESKASFLKKCANHHVSIDDDFSDDSEGAEYKTVSVDLNEQPASRPKKPPRIRIIPATPVTLRTYATVSTVHCSTSTRTIEIEAEVSPVTQTRRAGACNLQTPFANVSPQQRSATETYPEFTTSPNESHSPSLFPSAFSPTVLRVAYASTTKYEESTYSAYRQTTKDKSSSSATREVADTSFISVSALSSSMTSWEPTYETRAFEALEMLEEHRRHKLNISLTPTLQVSSASMSEYEECTGNICKHNIKDKSSSSATREVADTPFISVSALSSSMTSWEPTYEKRASQALAMLEEHRRRKLNLSSRKNS